MGGKPDGEALAGLPGKVWAWVRFARDLILVLGVPGLGGIGWWLHEAQVSATEAQLKLAEAQSASLKAIHEAQQKAAETQAQALAEQNATLRLTQYDRALAEIKAQTELFNRERAQRKSEAEKLQSQIDELDTRLSYLGEQRKRGSDARYKEWREWREQQRPQMSPPARPLQPPPQ